MHSSSLSRRSTRSENLFGSVLLMLAIAFAGSPTCAFGQFVYAIDADNRITGFSVDAKTQALAPVPNSPFAAGHTPVAVAVDPKGRFVYVANAGSDNVSAFTIDAADGSLTPFSQSPFASGSSPSGIAADPAGRFVYVSNSRSGNISAYFVDRATPALISVDGSPFTAGVTASGVAVHPGGRFLYVANAGSGSISAYTIDLISGALTPLLGSPYVAARNISDVSIDPTGRFAYFLKADGSAASVWVYNIVAGSGELTPVSNSPFAIAIRGAVSFAIDPAGQIAYISSASEIAACNIDNLTGALVQTPGSRLGVGRALLPMVKSPFVASLLPHRIAVAGLPNASDAAPPGTALITGFTTGPLSNNFTAGFGMQFTVGATALNVTALGRIYIPGSNGTHLVKLVSVSNGNDVPGGSVVISFPSGIPGQFAYASLANPVTLAPDTSWYLLSSETSGGDPFYELGPVTASSLVNVNSGIVDWPGNGLIPVGPPNDSYGPVNLLYLPAGPQPVVSITSPTPGTTVSGSSVILTADAIAGAGSTISSVQFQVDNMNYGAPLTTGPYSIALDTTKLANGAHTLTASATDSVSDSGTSAPVNITVANRPTSVVISTPADGATVSGSIVVSATVNAATGLTIAGVQFQLDNVNYGPVFTKAPYSILLDSTLLSDGTHFLIAFAADSSGTTVASPVVSITVNNSATSVVITSPLPGAAVSGNNITVAATATARVGLTISGVQFQLDNVNYGGPVTTNPYNIVLDVTPLSDGVHSLLAIIMDSSGTVVTSSPVSITVSHVSPPPSGSALIVGFTAGAPRNNFTGGFGMRFTVGVTPLNVIALGRIYIAGNTGTHLLRLVSVNDGLDVPGSSVSISPPFGTAGQFAYAPLVKPVTLAANTAYYLISSENQGGDQFYDLGQVTTTNVISVDSGVVDWPGNGLVSVGPANTSYVPVSLLYLQAGPPPVVTITAPVQGITLAGTTVPLTAAATSGTGLLIASVQFQVDGVNYGSAVTTNPFSITLDTTKLTNGAHMITAVATDSANDIGTSTPVSVIVSNRPTSIVIATPANGALISGSVVVSASAAPASGSTISSVQFQLDGVNYGTVVSVSTYSVTLDSTQLTDGGHVLVAIATDSAGLAVMSLPVSITVSNGTTAVAITSPVAMQTVSGNNVTLAATAIARTGLTISQVQFQVDKVNYGTPVTAGPYSMVLDSTALTDGTHSVVAIATDSAGITVASSSVSFNVNNSSVPPSGTALITGFTAGPLRNNFTGGFGMQFTVGAKPLKVTALGRIYIAGNTGTHTLRLVSAIDGTDVLGGSINVYVPLGTPGQFVYVPLINPVTLDTGTSWYLISSETNGGDQFYDIVPVTAASVISLNSGVVEWPATGVFPVGPPNYSYGPVNMLYSVPQ